MLFFVNYEDKLRFELLIISKLWIVRKYIRIRAKMKNLELF